MATTSGDGTGSLEKALDILEIVGLAPSGLSQSALAERLQLPRATVYRLLATLVARGLLRRDPLRRVFCLGFKCFEMARQVWTMPDLISAAAVELRGLRDLTGETTYLATMDGLEMVSLERVDGAHSKRSSAALGDRKPLHCTSQGKAMMAVMPVADQEALVKSLNLKPHTPFTITDRRRLLAELRITLTRGWSLDDEEIVVGVRCVGAAVIDRKGAVRGAISVAGPAWRMTRQRLDLLGPEVMDAARRIGAQLVVRAPLTSESELQGEFVNAVNGSWAFRGGGMVWKANSKTLYWADMLAPSVRVCSCDDLDTSTDEQLASFDSPVTGLVFVRDRLLVANTSGWTWLDPSGQQTPCQDWPPLEVCAMTVAPDSDRSVWVAVGDKDGGGCSIGVLSTEGRTAGKFDVRWHTSELLSGLAWKVDGSVLFATAPKSGTVFRFQLGNAGIRRLASIPRGSGKLGGIAVDLDGGIWVAIQEGWCVMRLTPDGEIDKVVGLPVPSPTDLAVGGTTGRTLFITTDRQSVPLDTLASAPLSGRLLHMQI